MDATRGYVEFLPTGGKNKASQVDNLLSLFAVT